MDEEQAALQFKENQLSRYQECIERYDEMANTLSDRSNVIGAATGGAVSDALGDIVADNLPDGLDRIASVVLSAMGGAVGAYTENTINRSNAADINTLKEQNCEPIMNEYYYDKNSSAPANMSYAHPMSFAPQTGPESLSCNPTYTPDYSPRIDAGHLDYTPDYLTTPNTPFSQTHSDNNPVGPPTPNPFDYAASSHSPAMSHANAWGPSENFNSPGPTYHNESSSGPSHSESPLGGTNSGNTGGGDSHHSSPSTDNYSKPYNTTLDDANLSDHRGFERNSMHDPEARSIPHHSSHDTMSSHSSSPAQNHSFTGNNPVCE